MKPTENGRAWPDIARGVLVVAGARPNFMKVAPILVALERAGIATTLVHTGQHYDPILSDSMFQDLGIRQPDHHLDVRSGSQAMQTARILMAFEPVLLQVRPAWVVVVGDVNSTLACSLVTAKLRDELDCRIAHVEAGLRSHDWRMPEEVNRVLTDRIADLLFTPSRDAHVNLRAEGIDDGRVVFAGNVMIDTLLTELPRARELRIPESLGLKPGGYAVVTLHRPSNVDDPRSLRVILEGLLALSSDLPVVFPLHPRTRERCESFGLGPLLDGMIARAPMSYLEMLSLTDGAAAVLTDSGGLQEETTVLGVPCVTLREQTERPVTITEGTNRLAPWPLSSEGIAAAAAAAVARTRRGVAERVPEGWDGKASARIAAHLAALSNRRHA